MPFHSNGFNIVAGEEDAREDPHGGRDGGGDRGRVGGGVEVAQTQNHQV